jgi:IS605 OrfB family transposase
MLEQWRWYYNYTVDVHRDMNLRIDEIKKNIKDLNLKLQGKLTKKLIKTVIDYTYSMPKNIRDEARDYSLDFSPFRETERGNILLQEVKYTPGQDRYYTPPWWKKVNGRVIRGAIFNYQSNLDSAISNRNVGNNKGFEMKYKKKTKDDILVFEDFNFPVALKKIEGYYGYRTNKSGSHKKRTSITVEDVIKNTSKRGCTFVHEKGTNNYYLHYPVEVDYFPSDDRRSNNHAPTPSKESAIFLDPGVRKFLYGFCPDGTRVIVGDHDSYEISTLLLQIDSELDQKTREKLWRKIKGMINDLHWKTIKFLTTNYKIIVLGDIHSQLCLKNPKLPRIVKRILNQYSFHKFKTKLIWACNLRGNDIIFLDEAFTTKACSCCGKCNWKVNKSEVFKCRKCKLILDRDENSSINMAIKSLSLMG